MLKPWQPPLNKAPSKGEEKKEQIERTQVRARRIAKPKRVSLHGKGTKSEIIAFNPRIVLTTIKIL